MNLLIKIYKKYGHLFQGRLFSAVILFYKYNRVNEKKGDTVKFILDHLSDMKVYGGTKRKSIEKLLAQAEFDNEGCTNFIYTWDIFKSAKIHNKIIGNCTIEYNKVLKYPLQDYYMESSSDFANDNNAVLDAIFKYLERLKIYVRESNIENKENIVKYIDRMKNKKAESLEEALQRILIVNQIQWQLGHILVGLGRLLFGFLSV